MKAKIVEIGNSKGLRLNKAILEQAGIRDNVTLEVSKHGILIKPILAPRFAWAKIFREMAELGDDFLLNTYTTSKFDKEEWEWS